jgi:hypothetical protein
LKTLDRFGDFQAEYEGSIPFTRSKRFRAVIPPSLMSHRGSVELAEADLDVVIRSIAKQQNKSLMEAARKRHARFMGMASTAKDKETKGRYKQIAKDTLLYASAAARRLHVTADNAADSYARSMKKAAEQIPAKKSVKKTKTQARGV